MLKLETKADLESLIAEGERESLTLEFKAGAALANDKKGEIGKDVSAMANADGGQIVYGIKERNHVASEIWPIDKRRFDHEWLEKVIRNNVSPAIEGLAIKMIDVGPEAHDVAFVVTVPAALALAPHQAKAEFRYYRRHNFSADPMADYEVREAMRRVTHPDLYVDMEFLFEQSGGDERRLRVVPTVSNRSTTPATYIALTLFSDCRLTPVHNSGGFLTTGAGRSRHPHDFDLYSVSLQMAPPAYFPVFREQAVKLQRHSWAFRGQLEGSYFGMGYRVATPGCEREEYFVLQVKGDRLVHQEKVA